MSRVDLSCVEITFEGRNSVVLRSSAMRQTEHDQRMIWHDFCGVTPRCVVRHTSGHASLHLAVINGARSCTSWSIMVKKFQLHLSVRMTDAQV